MYAHRNDGFIALYGHPAAEVYLADVLENGEIVAYPALQKSLVEECERI